MAKGRKKKDAATKAEEGQGQEESQTEEKKAGRKIVFSSDSERYGQPPAFAQVGLKKISLPSAEEQLAGFEHEDAKLLKRAVPGYRWLEEKGRK